MRDHQPHEQRDTDDGHVAGGPKVDVLQVGEDDADEKTDGDDLAAAEDRVRDGDKNGAEFVEDGEEDVHDADALEHPAAGYLQHVMYHETNSVWERDTVWDRKSERDVWEREKDWERDCVWETQKVTVWECVWETVWEREKERETVWERKNERESVDHQRSDVSTLPWNSRWRHFLVHRLAVSTLVSWISPSTVIALLRTVTESPVTERKKKNPQKTKNVSLLVNQIFSYIPDTFYSIIMCRMIFK